MSSSVDRIFVRGRELQQATRNVKDVYLPYGRSVIVAGREIAEFFPKSDNVDFASLPEVEMMYTGKLLDVLMCAVVNTDTWIVM